VLFGRVFALGGRSDEGMLAQRPSIHVIGSERSEVKNPSGEIGAIFAVGILRLRSESPLRMTIF